MSTLFEITNEFEQVYALFTDPEVDDEVITDTLESIEGELEVKAGGYINVLKQMQMEVDACDKMLEHWTEKKNVRENSIKRLKKALCSAMIATHHDDKEGLKAGDYTLKVVSNGGKQPMKVDATKVPDNFCKVIVEPDNDKIRKALEQGEELPFAYLEERGKHITIK